MKAHGRMSESIRQPLRGMNKMGFSPGEFKDERQEASFHWEGGPRRIQLWNHDESELLISLTLPEARKAANHLSLLVEMAEADGL